MTAPIGFYVKNEAIDRGIQRLGFAWIDSKGQHRAVEFANTWGFDSEMVPVQLEQMAAALRERMIDLAEWKKGDEASLNLNDTFGSKLRVRIIRVYKDGTVKLQDISGPDTFVNHVKNLER